MFMVVSAVLGASPVSSTCSHPAINHHRSKDHTFRDGAYQLSNRKNRFRPDWHIHGHGQSYAADSTNEALFNTPTVRGKSIEKKWLTLDPLGVCRNFMGFTIQSHKSYCGVKVKPSIRQSLELYRRIPTSTGGRSEAHITCRWWW